MNSLETTVRYIKRNLNLTSASPLVRVVRPAYDVLLNSLYSQHGLVRVINGEEKLRVRPVHRYAHEDYEPTVFAHLKRNVKPGSVVLDIGAHVGLFTILLVRWAGPTGHVYAFEPTPETRAALEDHLVLNDVADHVTLIPMAVSDMTGTAMFYAATSSPENTLSSAHTRLSTAEAIEVPLTTIDDFCTKRNVVPTLIKIDIEGFELHALRGAKETLAQHRPAVLIELHPMNWPEIGESPATAAAILAQLGYRAVPLDGQKEPLVEYGHVFLEPLM